MARLPPAPAESPAPVRTRRSRPRCPAARGVAFERGALVVESGDEAKQLCDSIGNPRIGVTVDTFHANIEERNIPEAIRSLGSHLKHVHASENDRSLLGSGHIPFGEIVSTLKEMSYSGYLMIEGFGYSAKEKNSPGRLWAQKEVSPADLAANGVRYLNQLLRQSNE